jgi:hypothetical protein
MVEGFASRLRAGDNAPFYNGQQIPNRLFVRGNLCFDASPSLDEPSTKFGRSFATAIRIIHPIRPIIPDQDNDRCHIRGQSPSQRPSSKAKADSAVAAVVRRA